MYHYDEKEADRVVQFFGLLTHSKGSFAGQPFHLIDWQREYLTALFGHKREDGTRQYRRSYLSMAKGGGKSTFAAGIALYMLLADDEDGAFVALAASTRDQASLIYQESVNMVRHNPRLRDVCHVVPSKKEIHYPKRNGLLKAISSDAHQAHGLDLSCLIFDELHTIDNREYYDALLWGTSKDRRQPLTIYTTTAGYNRNSVCYEVYSYAKAIQSQKIKDEAFLPVIYEADLSNANSIDDETQWKASNPSYGVTINAQQFKADLEAAKASNASLSAFKRLKLNCWTSSHSQFIDLAQWDDCRRHYPQLTGKPIILGCDLASSRDLAALTGVIEDDGLYYVYCWAWTTEEAISKREKSNLHKFQPFIENNELTLTDGNVIDYKLIRQKIDEINKSNHIKSLVFDRWGSTETTQILIDKGYEVFNMPQSPAYYNEPCRRLERLVGDRKIAHDGNSLLRWCLGNVQVKESNGLIGPSKDKSTDKIDPISALLMALSQCREEQTAARVSRYESAGVFVL